MRVYPTWDLLEFYTQVRSNINFDLRQDLSKSLDTVVEHCE